MTFSNKQICILLLSITDCYNTIVIQNTASFMANTQRLIGLSQEKYIGWQTVMWFTFPVCLSWTEKWAVIVTVAEAETRKEKEKGKSDAYMKLKKKKKNLEKTHNLIRLSPGREMKKQDVNERRERWKTPQWNLQITILSQDVCALNLKKSRDLILILTPCFDSLRKIFPNVPSRMPNTG